MPKQLQPLAGRPLITWTLEVFLEHPKVDEVILVVPADFLPVFAEIIGSGSKVKLVAGGESRLDSTKCGLAAVSPWAEVVLIHDGVRPLVSAEHIEQVRLAAIKEKAAILAVNVVDTIKRDDGEGFVGQTVNRQALWQAQTPQGFDKELLWKIIDASEGARVTDEASLFEEQGFKVKLVPGSISNLKVTDSQDLIMAEALLMSRSAYKVSESSGLGNSALPPNWESRPKLKPKTTFPELNEAAMPKVGQGWDFHGFDPQRPLWLGCIHIPGKKGLSGHSDADVLAHALIDALLGAAGLGDIGQLFPPDQERWRGASGSKLLSLAYAEVREAGYLLINADLTLIGPEPKICDYRRAMISAVSKALGESENKINLKGKTTEGLGFIGRGEGLAAAATVLLALNPGCQGR
jgi:2-C-methyl-D-erythritol 4-phosphate cytidylyltransferase/2-C-methyl-D-erythritol 2,4-cyclodiphosphate synthase